MSLKSFFVRWREGILSLSALQLLRAKLWGLWGNVFGLLFAGVFLWIKGLWFVEFIMFFALVLQVVSLVETYKQVREVERLDQVFIEMGDK